MMSFPVAMYIQRHRECSAMEVSVLYCDGCELVVVVVVECASDGPVGSWSVCRESRGGCNDKCYSRGNGMTYEPCDQ